MPLYPQQQGQQMSCGAACIVAARREFGENIVSPGLVESIVYAGLSEKAGAARHYILPHRIARHMITCGHAAQIIESLATAGLAAADADLLAIYGLYTGGLGPLVRQMQNPGPGHLGGGARMFLVLGLPGGGLHYVLARNDGGQCYIMNPDGATDTQMAFPAIGACTIGAIHYVFLGIAIRVW